MNGIMFYGELEEEGQLMGSRHSGASSLGQQSPWDTGLPAASEEAGVKMCSRQASPAARRLPA